MPPQLPDDQPLPNPEGEARINQAHAHHAETSAQLDTLIQQGENNNPVPVLEAQIVHNDKSAGKLADAIGGLKPEVQRMSNAAEFIQGFLASIKGDTGEKGDKGDTGDKGEKGDQGE